MSFYSQREGTVNQGLRSSTMLSPRSKFMKCGTLPIQAVKFLSRRLQDAAHPARRSRPSTPNEFVTDHRAGSEGYVPGSDLSPKGARPL